MKIVLVRHGRPLLENPGRIPGRDLRHWYSLYNAAGIDPALPPPDSLCELAKSMAYVLSSDLRRAMESAEAIAPGRSQRADPVFREGDLPNPPFGALRLGAHTWGVISRIVWFLGRTGEAESAGAARGRARLGAERLIGLARTHGSVMLAAHGLINSLIAQELQRRGWRGPRVPTPRYWSHGIFTPR